MKWDIFLSVKLEIDVAHLLISFLLLQALIYFTFGGSVGHILSLCLPKISFFDLLHRDKKMLHCYNIDCALLDISAIIEYNIFYSIMETINFCGKMRYNYRWKISIRVVISPFLLLDWQKLGWMISLWKQVLSKFV